MAIVIAGFVLPKYCMVADRESDYTCAQHLAKIRVALAEYARVHGSLPGTLEDLVKSGLLGDDDIRCPTDDAKYAYFGATAGEAANREGQVIPIVACYQHYATHPDILFRYKRVPFFLTSEGEIFANFALSKMNVRQAESVAEKGTSQRLMKSAP